MKYQDMPYERVDFDRVEKEFNGLKEDFAAAKSGEEQFAVHERYYALRDRVDTMMTLAQTRTEIPRMNFTALSRIIMMK